MREIVLDTETTGLDPNDGHKVIEIGCVELVNKVKTGRVFNVYINPRRDVPKSAFDVHGISTEFLKDKKVFKEIADEFLLFIRDTTLIIHNARFDIGFLNKELAYIDKQDLSNFKYVDTLHLARRLFPGAPASLDALCKRFKIDLGKRTKHGALLDAELLAEVYINLSGGTQTKLNFSYGENRKSTDNINLLPKVTREERVFEVSSDEEKSHQELLVKIKDPLWSK